MVTAESHFCIICTSDISLSLCKQNLVKVSPSVPEILHKKQLLKWRLAAILNFVHISCQKHY